MYIRFVQLTIMASQSNLQLSGGGKRIAKDKSGSNLRIKQDHRRNLEIIFGLENIALT